MSDILNVVEIGHPCNIIIESYDFISDQLSCDNILILIISSWLYKDGYDECCSWIYFCK